MKGLSALDKAHLFIHQESVKLMIYVFKWQIYSCYTRGMGVGLAEAHGA